MLSSIVVACALSLATPQWEQTCEGCQVSWPSCSQIPSPCDPGDYQCCLDTWVAEMQCCGGLHYEGTTCCGAYCEEGQEMKDCNKYHDNANKACLAVAQALFNLCAEIE